MADVGADMARFGSMAARDGPWKGGLVVRETGTVTGLVGRLPGYTLEADRLP